MPLNIKQLGANPLQGRRLSLQPLGPQHADFLVQTYQLDEFMDCYRMAQDRAVTAEQICQRLEQEKYYTPQQLRRIEWVVTNKTHKPIGIASLADYQPSHHRAELLVGIVQQQDRHGHAGVEATLLVMEFAFNCAQLHKLTSFVYGSNEIAQKNTLHLGFQQEALLREHYFDHRRQQYIDLFQNGLVRQEFTASKRLARWSKRLLGRDITNQPRQASVKALSDEALVKGLETILANTKKNSE